MDFGLVILCESRRELPWSSLAIIPCVCFAFLILVDDKHLYGCWIHEESYVETIVFTFIFVASRSLVILFVTSR